ncbi:flagellin [Marinitoga hydrogenitolerans DSM 16785]|uniref:Flagellin n=1 Tax=Marinitoga hydrogenitolerans (strain DSM 16785 / JCM 12826 / AT1271) TaxID=1122195 RepID=A0A1M4XUH0_MARH1|nr:flagellin [Marinitoga hydrogenitolerans]SHE97227.1 flagellin [Marinitoga hydrogenitolerans DSM 16785]
MRIGNNYLNQTNRLSNLSNLLLQRSQQLSSGNRLINSAVDPAGFSMAQRLNTQFRSAYQAVRNIYDGIGALNVADQGISSINDTIGRMRELAVRAANDTLPEEARSAIQEEFNQLRQGITDTVRNTEYNNQQLLNGEFQVKLPLDASGRNNLNVEIQDMRPEALNLENIDLTTQEGAEAALTVIDNAAEQVTNTRTQVGAYVNRLGTAAENLLNAAENTGAAEERIAGTDMAKTMAEYLRNQNLQQMTSMLLTQTGQLNATSIFNILQSP